MSGDKPKFEFSGAGAFNVGAGAPAEDDKIVSGVGAISLQPAAAPAPGGENDDGGDDDQENVLSHLPPVIIKRVTAIRRMHVTIEEIDEEYRKERLTLEKKYLAKRQVILDERNKIVKGEMEAPPTAEEPELASQPADGEEEIKGIPGFWLTCLSSHHTIGELITEEDIPALESLKDITCDYADDFTAFTLTFHFDENEFFTNKELVKNYVISPDLLDDKAPALSDSTGTEINWKPNKNLCIAEIKKKQKAKSGRNKGQVRTVVTTKPKHSFFNYFAAPMTEEEEEEMEENEDEDDEDGPVRLNMEEDYDVGHAIRTSIIPEAVLWYTGEAIEDDGEEEDDDEEDDEDEDDDEDGDDDDDDDEEEEEQPPPKSKGKGNKKGGKGKGGGLTFTPEGGFAAPAGAGQQGQGAGGEQPECKQN